MTIHSRYAIYYAPRPGSFATAAAKWLGRDCETGHELLQPQIDNLGEGLATYTSKPRKYGFHGTLRAPFRPVDGQDLDSIAEAVSKIAARLSPASCGALILGNPYGFGLALYPKDRPTEILNLAARVVEDTDTLRAPLSFAELTNRELAESLNTQQRHYLYRWGYPMVMEELCFQLTLTNRISADNQAKLENAATEHFAGVIPTQFVIDDLCLFGEDSRTGMFHLLHRFPLKS